MDPAVDTAFVFNPTAQSGAAADCWDEIARRADELGIRFERFDTRPGGGTTAMVADVVASRRFTSLVGFGGDGTVSAIIQGMMRARNRCGVERSALPALTVVPFGTGNDIAKSFNIPSAGASSAALRKGMEAIRYGADFPLDLGQVDGRYFADAFSLGVDPSLLAERNKEREKVRHIPFVRQFLRDYLLYAFVMLRFPFLQRNVAATLTLEGGGVVTVPDLTNLVVNNTKVYAGEFVFSEDCRANDGLLDVILFRGWRDYLSKFVVAARVSPLDEEMLRKVLVTHSENYQTRRLEVRLSHPLSSQVDGEEHRTGDHFQVACVEDALTLRIPVG